MRQAVEILPLWVDIDVDDALELLGKEFENRSVRTYAVNQLRKANDDVKIILILFHVIDPKIFLFIVHVGFVTVLFTASPSFEI